MNGISGEAPTKSGSTPLECLNELYERGAAIMEKKNHDYSAGNSDAYINFRGSYTFGIHPVIGILLRTQDKLKRIQAYTEQGSLKVENEGVVDALTDVVNYMALAYGLIKENE